MEKEFGQKCTCYTPYIIQYTLQKNNCSTPAFAPSIIMCDCMYGICPVVQSDRDCPVSGLYSLEPSSEHTSLLRCNARFSDIIHGSRVDPEDEVGRLITSQPLCSLLYAVCLAIKCNATDNHFRLSLTGQIPRILSKQYRSVTKRRANLIN